jgi:hypothetical protein
MEICTEIPSLPVALLILILSICFSTNEISIDSKFCFLSSYVLKKINKGIFYRKMCQWTKQKDFWPTIKSFITNKGSYFGSWFMYGAGCCVLLRFFKGMFLFTTSKKDDSKVSYVLCISLMSSFIICASKR